MNIIWINSSKDTITWHIRQVLIKNSTLPLWDILHPGSTKDLLRLKMEVYHKFQMILNWLVVSTPLKNKKCSKPPTSQHVLMLHLHYIDKTWQNHFQILWFHVILPSFLIKSGPTLRKPQVAAWLRSVSFNSRQSSEQYQLDICHGDQNLDGLLRPWVTKFVKKLWLLKTSIKDCKSTLSTWPAMQCDKNQRLVVSSAPASATTWCREA